VTNAATLLVSQVTARLAILGSGGMGKTTVALALLHNSGIAEYYRNGRLFLSCEALIDADTIVVALAKLLDISATSDLLTAVVANLKSRPRTVLVLDNLETVWLRNGGPDTAVDELLGKLAQVPSLSLIITCRGTDLPQFVRWSNSDWADLKAFSLEAALQTFQDRAGSRLVGAEEKHAIELLNAVDRMPLAVSLLGQLARRGNSVSELLDRWNRKRTALLRTHGIGRINNVGVSVELSISMVCSADGTRESLQLLSLCSTLPDGLRRAVFTKLRPQFEDIDEARDNLLAYSLASLDVDGVLRMLSPVRHHVLERYPALPVHHTALCAIYFEVAQQMPIIMDEHFKERAAATAPEIDNLSSLLLTLVHQPSHQLVEAVYRLTFFEYWHQPNITVALAVIPYLQPHPKWKARCLRAIGSSQVRSGKYRAAIVSLLDAGRLFLDVGDRFQAAWCKCVVGDTYRVLHEHDRGEAMLNEALQLYHELRLDFGEAECRMYLGELMRMKGDYAAAIEHSSMARQTFSAFREQYYASQCTVTLGTVYLAQGELYTAAVELEAASSTFIRLGDKHQLACNKLLISTIRRKQYDFETAEQLLGEVETIFKDRGNRLGLATCAYELARLRIDQGRREKAVAHFKSALTLYDELQIKLYAEDCRNEIEKLESSALPVDNGFDRP